MSSTRFQTLRISGRRCWAAVVAAALLVSPAMVSAQNRREQLTQLMREAELKVEKATTDAEKVEARDQLERYRHELGYWDGEGKRINWDVAYHKTLGAALATKITEMEGLAKGAWGLQPAHEDAMRAWRILARSLLQRSDEEGDWNERNRYALGGMVLAHNADAVDALLAELPKIEAARKAAPEGDAFEPQRRTLDRGLGGGRGLVDLARRVAEGKTKVGHGELRDIYNRLSQIRQAAKAVESDEAATAPSGPGDGGADQQAQNEEYLKRAVALDARVKRIKASHAEMGEQLVLYLDQVRFGIGVEQARALAVTLLEYLERIVVLFEEVSASEIASDGYRKKAITRLAEAVGRIGAKKTRDEGYRNISDLERDDATRKRIEAFPIPRAAKANLWRGYEWAENVLTTQGDDPEHQMAGKIRHVLGQLAWRGSRTYADEKPADRYLGGTYRKGVEVFEAAMARAGELMGARGPEAERAVWDAINVLNDLDRVRNVDRAMAATAEYVDPGDAVRRACGVVAARLFDDDRNNDNPSRDRLRDGVEAFDLVRELEQTALTREDLAEAAQLSRNKYYPAYRAQQGHSLIVLKTMLEGDRNEYRALEAVMPAYRMMAAHMVLRRAEQRGYLDRLLAARWLTVDPARVLELCRESRGEFARIFPDLARTRPEDLGGFIGPIRKFERPCRTAAGALLELQRDTPRRDRLEVLLDDLLRTSQGDPGNEPRDRWRVSWELNQALEAFGRGYQRTGAWHAANLAQSNPLLGVPLSVKGE